MNSEPLDTNQRLEKLLDRLRLRGHRLTPQRRAIIKALVENPTHPSADTVYAAIKPEFPTTSLATVYKTIAMLKEAGEILELEFGDESSRFDAMRPRPHPHLICTRCGLILDVDMAGFEEMSEDMASRAGFEAAGARFDVFGLCPDCRKLPPETD